MKRHFYLQDDRSNKFWTIELSGRDCITRFGRVGAKARETRKTFSSEEEAQRDFDKQIEGKVRKGYTEGEPPPYEAPDWGAMSMSDEVFWRLVGLLNWKKTGDDDAVVAPVVKALSQMSVADIEHFERLLSEKLFALDTEAHAREIGEYAYESGEYMSLDLFLYARCVVVANGPDFYASVLENPEAMPKDMEFEALLYIAGNAFERRTGKEYSYVSPTSYETFSNKEGW